MNTSNAHSPKWTISPWALSEKFLFLVDQKWGKINQDTRAEYISKYKELSKKSGSITPVELEKIIQQIRLEEKLFKETRWSDSQFHSTLWDIAWLLEGIKKELDNSVWYIEDTETTISIPSKQTLPEKEINLLLEDATIERHQVSLSQKYFSLNINGFDYFYYKIMNPNPKINVAWWYTRVLAVWSKGNIQRRAYLSIHLPIKPNQKIDVSNIGRISLRKTGNQIHDPIVDSHFMAPEFVQYPTTEDIKNETQEKYQKSLSTQNAYINFGEKIWKNIALEIDGFEFFHIQPISNSTDVWLGFQQWFMPVRVSFKRKEKGGSKKEEMVNTIIRISPLVGKDPKILNIDPIYIDNKSINSLNIFSSIDNFIIKGYSPVTPLQEHDSLSEPPIETNTWWNFLPKKNERKPEIPNSLKTPEPKEKSSTTWEKKWIIPIMKTWFKKAWSGMKRFLWI